MTCGHRSFQDNCLSCRVRRLVQACPSICNCKPCRPRMALLRRQEQEAQQALRAQLMHCQSCKCLECMTAMHQHDPFTCDCIYCESRNAFDKCLKIGCGCQTWTPIHELLADALRT